MKLLEKAGEITALCWKVQFRLVGNTYYSDFVCFNNQTKQWIIKYSMGMRTQTYKIMARQMPELYGIKILET